MLLHIDNNGEEYSQVVIVLSHQLQYPAEACWTTKEAATTRTKRNAKDGWNIVGFVLMLVSSSFDDEFCHMLLLSLIIVLVGVGTLLHSREFGTRR